MLNEFPVQKTPIHVKCVIGLWGEILARGGISTYLLIGMTLEGYWYRESWFSLPRVLLSCFFFVHCHWQKQAHWHIEPWNKLFTLQYHLIVVLDIARRGEFPFSILFCKDTLKVHDWKILSVLQKSQFKYYLYIFDFQNHVIRRDIK